MNSRIIELLNNALRSRTGEAPEKLLSMPIDEMRDHFEKINRSKMKITSYFPVIGRGNVLRDNLISHEEVINTFEESIKD